MQTFLPYRDIELSLQCLDKGRLGKQRVEAKQILDLVLGKKTNNWINHPAVRMWIGYEGYLIDYYNKSLEIFADVGGNNIKLINITNDFEKKEPKWLGDERLHISHRCNLLRKNFKHYFEYFGNTYDVNAPYWWPSGLKNKKNHELMMEYWNKEGAGMI